VPCQGVRAPVTVDLRGRLHVTFEILDGNSYSLTFHTYKYVESVAVATFRPAFRVARFSAERTFAMDSTSSASGIFKAEPGFNRSRSFRIVVTIRLCFPLRPCGIRLHYGLEVHRRAAGMALGHNVLRREITLNQK